MVRFAEAARAYGLPTVFGAELTLGMTRPQMGEPDPEGDHLVVVVRRVVRAPGLLARFGEVELVATATAAAEPA